MRGEPPLRLRLYGLTGNHRACCQKHDVPSVRCCGRSNARDDAWLNLRKTIPEILDAFDVIPELRLLRTRQCNVPAQDRAAPLVVTSTPSPCARTPRGLAK